VEDDPDQLALAELRVGMAGFAVRTAASAGALQAELLNHAAPDLLLLDILLPDGNGFDLLAALRSHPAHALLPIVMLTVKDKPEDIRRGLGLGADGYVTKPYSKKLLEDVFVQVLKLGSPEG
jgi:DNA-binding response OmpR family regulator